MDKYEKMDIPIFYITQCYVRLLSDDLWNEKVKPMILYMRKGCSKLMSYWKTKFNYPVEQELCDLIGWAAHEKMYDLLIRNESL